MGLFALFKCLVLLLKNLAEYVIEGSLYDAFVRAELRGDDSGSVRMTFENRGPALVENGTLDCECLASTGLAICKDGAIVSFETALCNRFGNMIEDGRLIDCFAADIIEIETLFVHPFEEFKTALLNIDTALLAMNVL